MAVSQLKPRIATPVISVPEPELQPKDLIARAIALRPKIRADREQAETRGTYSPELHEEFKKAGFYRITQPRMFGGYEFDLPVFFKTMIEVSTGHPGIGWCLTLAASHAWLVSSHFPEAAQRDFFGTTGEFAAPHRAAPTGTVKCAPGGYIVNGFWSYCSGVPYSTHFCGNALLHEEGQPVKNGIVVLPRDKYTIVDDWGGDNTLGMRASGSNSVKVTDVFVPEHHVVWSDSLFARPEEMANGTPGAHLHGNPMYLGRLMGPYHASLVSTMIGAARAAIDEFERIITTQKLLFDPTTMRADNVDSQRPLGYAIALADAAEGILISTMHKYMDLCREWAASGRLITIEDNLRLWAAIQQAGRLACEVVEHLFANAGPGVARKGQALQNYYRDISMYRGHSSAQYQMFGTLVARAHLGKPLDFRGL
jgi:3-hydroxy-9,10-secoandrosta-1,3,5(10)-triene-9,17-dione monooxygenase